MEKLTQGRVLPKDLIKSKKRVADHGEVFTPPWLVEAMLNLSNESDRVEARFLETACGTGNFLIRVLQRKLGFIEKTRTSASEKKHFALSAVMSLYGIELLEDNVLECRQRLLGVFADYLKIETTDEFYRAAVRVVFLNVIHGDALKMRSKDGRPILFSEWNYTGQGNFQRRDFRFDLLTQASASQDIAPAPTKLYPSLTVCEIGYSVTKMRELEL
jgi:hypothetical protein